VKCAPYAQLTRYSQRSTHQIDKLSTDGQPQPGTAKAPGGRRLCLGKTGEYQLQALRGDADAGISHLKLQFSNPMILFKL